MVDWYMTALAMRVVHRNDFICFLTYDAEHHRLAIVNIADLHAPDARSWGLAHVAYTFRDVGELLSTYRTAYLESSNSATIPFYRRHGFEALGVIGWAVRHLWSR